MKTFILYTILNLFGSISLTTNFDNFDCKLWEESHIFSARDVHFYNKTFVFVKINTLDDLNVSLKCKPKEYNIEDLKIYANKNILLNNDLNLDGVLHLINRANVEINVIFENVNGFNENTQMVERIETNYKMIRSFQMNFFNFDFYRKGNLI